MSLKADAVRAASAFLFHILCILLTHFLRFGMDVRPPIEKPFPFRAFDRRHGAGCVIDAKSNAVIPLEGDFVDVPLQVMFAYRVVRAVHLPFDDRVEAFSGVDVNEATQADVFVLAVVYSHVASKLLAGRDVNLGGIRHEVGRLIDVRQKVIFDIRCGHIRNVLRADGAITFNQRHNSVLLRLGLAVVDVLFLAAHIGFVAFDNLVAAANRAAGFGIIRRHRFADAHLKKPGALVLKAQHPAELMGTHALLRSGHQPEGKEPLRKRDVAALHNRIGADRELLAALAAMVVAGCRLGVRVLLRRLAHHGFGRQCMHRLLLLAEGANSTIRPALSFKVLAGFVFVVENRIRDVNHGLILVDINIGD